MHACRRNEPCVSLDAILSQVAEPVGATELAADCIWCLPRPRKYKMAKENDKLAYTVWCRRRSVEMNRRAAAQQTQTQPLTHKNAQYCCRHKLQRTHTHAHGTFPSPASQPPAPATMQRLLRHSPHPTLHTGMPTEHRHVHDDNNRHVVWKEAGSSQLGAGDNQLASRPSTC